MNDRNKDAAVLAGRGARNYIPGGMQAQISTLRLLYGSGSSSLMAGEELLAEVTATRRRGLDRPVRLFVGRDAMAWARAWRFEHGAGTAMVLPLGVHPKAVAWPPVDRIAVVWTQRGILPRELAIQLARALKRAGVKFASLPHELDQPNVWLAATAAEARA